MDAWSAPRRPVRELRPGDHALLEYGGAEERDHVAGGFVRDGLNAGRRVVWCEPADGGLYGIDPEPYLASGLLRLLNPEKVCRTKGGFDPDRLFARLGREIGMGERAGLTPIRMGLDLTWVLGEQGGFDLLLECERMLAGALGSSGSVMALCAFDRRACPAAELAALRALHAPPVSADPEYEDSVLRLTRLFEPSGLAVCGEIDASRHGALEGALKSLANGGGHELRIDLAELRFIDFGALRILADFAAERTLVLDPVPAQLRTVMEIVGWTALPGLRLGDAEAMTP